MDVGEGTRGSWELRTGKVVRTRRKVRRRMVVVVRSSSSLSWALLLLFSVIVFVVDEAYVRGDKDKYGAEHEGK